MNKQSKINLLTGISEGRISADQLKKQLARLNKDPNIIPLPIPEGQQTEIRIKTDYSYVYLNYEGVTGPGGCEMDIAICKRHDERFKRLDSDSQYIVTIPAPGIEVLDLPKYFGPMEVRTVMD